MKQQFRYMPIPPDTLRDYGLTCVALQENKLVCGRHADYYVEQEDEAATLEPHCTQHFVLALSAFKQEHVLDEIEPFDLSQQNQIDPVDNSGDTSTQKVQEPVDGNESNTAS